MFCFLQSAPTAKYLLSTLGVVKSCWAISTIILGPLIGSRSTFLSVCLDATFDGMGLDAIGFLLEMPQNATQKGQKGRRKSTPGVQMFLSKISEANSCVSRKRTNRRNDCQFTHCFLRLSQCPKPS